VIDRCDAYRPARLLLLLLLLMVPHAGHQIIIIINIIKHWGILPIMLGRAKPPISGQGRGPMDRSPRPKGPRAEVGFLGRGQPASLLPTNKGDLGSAVSSPNGFRGGAWPLEVFLAFYKRQMSSPSTCWGPSFGEGHGLIGPLNSPMSSKLLSSKSSDVNKDTSLKAKARTKDLTLKVKVKTKD